MISLRSLPFVLSLSVVVASFGCAAPADSTDGDSPDETAASTDQSALETSFTRSYGKCQIWYEQNQSYARITQNGHCDYITLSVSCRDDKGIFSSNSTAAIGSNNPSYVDRTCYTRPHALSWWPSWDHVYSKYTAMVAVDFCAGASIDACTRWRWNGSGPR